MQAVVELALEGPFKLRVVQIPRVQVEIIETQLRKDAVKTGVGFGHWKIVKQWLVVSDQWLVLTCLV